MLDEWDWVSHVAVESLERCKGLVSSRSSYQLCMFGQIRKV